MARIQNNALVRGARGNFAKQFVFKRRGNDTHIAQMPKLSKNVTAGQEAYRELFALASQYAKGAIADAQLKKEYQQKAGPANTAYNMALRDYLKPPVVKSIDASNYDGTVGSTIAIIAKDDFRVASVMVSIRDINDVLIEQGAALLNPINLNKWVYTAITHNANLPGSVIRVEATDLPGNNAALELSL